jgi:hypothetical protein
MNIPCECFIQCRVCDETPPADDLFEVQTGRAAMRASVPSTKVTWAVVDKAA